MAKREFLQLAHTYKSQDIGGFFYSEKLDGFRVFWDGGVSIGLHSCEVPWANTAKDHIHTRPIMSTGLWTRYGNVVHAPEWLLKKLPDFPLDGELYLGRGNFQKLRSIASTYPWNRNDDDWKDIQLLAFSVPKMSSLLAPGKVDTINFKIDMPTTAYEWWQKRYNGPPSFNEFSTLTFRKMYPWLRDSTEDNDNFKIHPHYPLPTFTKDALREVMRELDSITSLGGEGIMVRDPWSLWTPERCHSLLKFKKLHDAEGKVMGFKAGTETDKGSKLLGMIGAITLQYTNEAGNVVTFDISGFTNEEREFATEEMSYYARSHPGEVMPDWVESKHFPRGSTVTFRYRELTKDGVPKEARFFRT